MFAGSTFVRLVEKATSQLLLEPDWDSTLQICDAIRQGDIQPKYALQTVKKKISQDNPHVSMFALHVLESCVKNCGGVVHEEVATKEFMEFLKDLVKKRPDPVKAKILELVQVWSHAFRNEPGYKVVQDTFHLMKMEGYTFPSLKESDVMFNAERAPEWKDGECCHRCRVGFGTFQRKHHCRHCGNIFCGKCSSKNSIIPKFGLEREVRVCDSCYEEINGPSDKKEDESLPTEYLNSPLSKQAQVKPTPAKCDRDLQEEEELQLALALSMSEANNKKESNRVRSSGASSAPISNDVYAQPAKVTSVIDTSDMDPELARYLNRNYWQQKNEAGKTSTTQPSAPAAAAEPKMVNSVIGGGDAAAAGAGEKQEENYQMNGESSDNKQQFLDALRSSIEIFENRMRSNSARGRSIATDSSVQTLFMTINAMHPQLMKYLSELEDSRAHYETLQDKLAQLKDAREALDALRAEQREKRRLEQEELERQRQIQMAQKLDILRQKKQEYLEYQRQMALQRMNEQAREMEMRMEQQKHMAQVRAQSFYQNMYNQQPQGFSPDGSPLHQAHPAGAPMGGPGPYQSMPVAPGAPGGQLPGQMAPPNQLPPGAMNQMYPQPGYQGAPVPGGYQLPPGGYPATTYPGGVAGQQFSVPTTQPTVGQPPPQQPQPQQPEIQNYNMQSLNNALPNQGLPGLPVQGMPQQQSIPGQPYMGNPQGQYVPPGGQPLQQQPPSTEAGAQQPLGQPQDQPPPPTQGQNEAELAQLISL